MRRNAMTALMGILALATAIGAQTKPPATFADYGQWESVAQAGANG
ncbi:MAG: hypothetical protein H6Q05_1799, partial [Acidobacteria bacterium]|nr:hypothetical protein [Acidobacteriota bacterium]